MSRTCEYSKRCHWRVIEQTVKVITMNIKHLGSRECYYKAAVRSVEQRPSKDRAIPRNVRSGVSRACGRPHV
jgi:hypothetical protein